MSATHTKEKNLVLSFGPTAAVVLITIFLFVFSIFGLLELNLRDLLFFTRTKNPSDEILIVEIDDYSQEKIGRFPWDRNAYADIINVLSSDAKRPKVIAFDIAFFEKAAGDEAFIKALEEAKKINTNIVLASQLKETASDVRKISPITEFAQYTQEGFINLFSEEEGIIRHSPLRYKARTDTYQSFTLKILENYFGNKDETIEKLPDNILVNYTGPAGNIRSVSFYDAVNADLPDELFKDKIVFIGATAPTLHDDRPVPGSQDFMPGVEIHANAVDTIISNRILSEVIPLITLALIVTFALAVGYLTYRYNPFVSLATTLLLAILYGILVIFLFSQNILLPILYPILAIFFSWLLNYISKYVQKTLESRKVRQVFSNYVSREVLDEIMENLDNLQLGGKKRNMTVLFTDIRGFTEISEQTPAQKLIPILNDFLTIQSNEVMKNQGVIDKFIGDAIMALFGAPLKDIEHAYHACLSAISMVKNSESFTPFTKVANLPAFRIGVGINSGEMVVGNIGATNRFNYTAIGDNVNLASRLESLNKLYGAQILISENTARELQKTNKFNDLSKSTYNEELINCILIDRVRVKGKANAVDIYAIWYETPSKKDSEILETFSSGLQSYLKGDWNTAKKLIEKVTQSNNLSLLRKTSQVILERISLHKDKSPKDWDGAWKLDSK
jgi:adenylate cyclase